MFDLKLAVSITTLKVRGLNIPSKRWKWSDWVKKQDSNMLPTKKKTYIRENLCDLVSQSVSFYI